MTPEYKKTAVILWLYTITILGVIVFVLYNIFS